MKSKSRPQSSWVPIIIIPEKRFLYQRTYRLAQPGTTARLTLGVWNVFIYIFSTFSDLWFSASTAGYCLQLNISVIKLISEVFKYFFWAKLHVILSVCCQSLTTIKVILIFLSQTVQFSCEIADNQWYNCLTLTQSPENLALEHF